MKTTTIPLKHSTNLAPFQLVLLLIPLALAYFALAPTTRAVSPPPDGGYPGGNTAEGTKALLGLTTGVGNSALGFQALKFNTTGNQNTATGFQALLRNTTGVSNTATGTDALQSNKTAINNTAIGVLALQSNDSSELGIANFNTAVGVQALFSNVDGNSNNAVGFNALGANVDGLFNQAMGFGALSADTNGSANIAIGDTALFNSISGSFNTVIGDQAGQDITDGTDNIYIGATAGNAFGDESGHIRIGDPNFVSTCFIAGISGVAVTGDPVVVNANGQLGVAISSERFKDGIKPMDKASEAILALKPVTFRYKHELDPAGIPQFGLVAEEVEKVNPDLVARDADGKAYTVRYEAVNAMLLNEFLKEHRKVQEQEATIIQLKKDFEAAATGQQKQIEALRAGLQKVSAQLELTKSASRTVLDNQ